MDNQQNYAGIISFSRTESSGTPLYGSPLIHRGYISITISDGQLIDGKHYSRLNGRLIQVALSYSQFAEAITCMNIGDGVPCTIKHVKGMAVTPPEAPDPLSVDIGQELDDCTSAALQNLSELLKAIEEEKMSKKARDRLIRLANNTITQLKANLPYIAEIYQEYLEKLKQEVKTEIVSYADMIQIQRGLGENALPTLPEGKRR